MRIATLERIEILDKAEGLAKMIVESELAEEYRRAFWRLKQDRRAQELISRFVQLKEQYEDVQRFGKYHPDYRPIMKAVREAKRELDLHETVAAFKQAEKALQQLLDEISVLIGKAVSEHVKVPTGNPYFLSAGCSGGCRSGGGCGCRT
ncbi:YlbF family regulator [Geobacillus sp. FSL W8-0032]|uniref:YlbF family regulator n=1 Tax=Geobacillus TaxID=129337 RepID=UPI0005011F0C|nr:YlbF family regulator [Geobacillus icigianus]